MNEGDGDVGKANGEAVDDEDDGDAAETIDDEGGGEDLVSR